VKAGSDVVIKVTLENTEDHPITLLVVGLLDEQQRAEATFCATVKDGRGNTAPYTKHGMERWGAEAAQPGIRSWSSQDAKPSKERWGSCGVAYGAYSGPGAVEIQPGQSVTQNLIISQLFDLSKSGVYVIQVSRPHHEGSQYPYRHPPTESNIITVAVY